MSSHIKEKTKVGNATRAIVAAGIAFTLAMILWSPRELSALPLCSDEVSVRRISSSCWQPNPKELTRKKVSRIELSSNTLNRMLELAPTFSPPGSPVVGAMKRLVEQSKGFSLTEGFAFYYDYQKGEKDNSDCYFYFRPKIDSVDRSQRSSQPIDGPACNESACVLAQLAIEAWREHSYNIADPFNKYFLAGYPDAIISKKFGSASYDDTVLFELYNRLSITSPWQEVYIPVWIYETKSVISLKSIAWAEAGNVDHWRMLWGLNIDNVENPFQVPKDTKIKIPAKIVGWRAAVPFDFTNTWGYAYENYGDPEYGELVRRYFEEAKQMGVDAIALPVFSDDHPLEKAVLHHLE